MKASQTQTSQQTSPAQASSIPTAGSGAAARSRSGAPHRRRHLSSVAALATAFAAALAAPAVAAPQDPYGTDDSAASDAATEVEAEAATEAATDAESDPWTASQFAKPRDATTGPLLLERTDEAAPYHSENLGLVLNGGLELTGGDGAFASAFRGRALIAGSLGSGAVRPQLAIGGTFSAGNIWLDDPRALDGSLSLGYATYGAEAQAGLRFANGGFVDSRIYASLAVFKVSTDERLMYDHVPGISNAAPHGFRAAIGATWVDRLIATDDDCHRDRCRPLSILLPHHVELAYERSAGSGRMGVFLGWGI